MVRKAYRGLYSYDRIEATSKRSSIRPEYRTFEGVLLEPEGGLLLPEYSEDDYKIVLYDKVGLRTRPIYVLDNKKKKALREYVDKNLKRGYIRHLNSRVT